MNNLRHYLRKELKKKYPSKILVNDGILVPEIYSIQNIKVMFLLKETFGDYNLIKGPQEIFNGKSSPFWPNIFNWTNIVNDINFEFCSKWAISEITNFIDSIAYVNIKKVNENRKKSDHKDILAYAKADAHLLKYQIDQIEADVIFTSKTTLGSYRIIYANDEITFVKSVSCDRQQFELYEHKGRKIIKSFHPAAYPVKQEKGLEALKELIT